MIMELKLKLNNSEAWIIYKALRNNISNSVDSVEERIINELMAKLDSFMNGE